MEGLLISRDLENTDYSLQQNHVMTAPPVHVHIQENLSAESGGNELIWMDASSGQTIITLVQTILLIVFCVFGTLANSLVFWVFNRRPALRSLSNRFVLSLVTANILISSIISPLMLFEGILNYYLLFPCLTEVISMIGSAVIFSAIFSTSLIATDRFYAVTSPLHYSMTITRSRSQLMIIAAWLAGSLLALPYIIICSLPLNIEIHQTLHVLFIVLQLAVGYFIPFIGLCWLYLRMYHAAHLNSERTRKHSISGELLTVMDGSTSVIPPQGIDFLTHYINPFTKPMVGGAGISVPPAGVGGGNSIGQIVPAAIKKQRRRSSNGSSSSLLFREEGRAIKTALLVLVSFLICWTPHFAFILINEINALQNQWDDLVLGSGGFQGNASTTASFHSRSVATMSQGTEWARFFGVLGILLSCLLNPFIYVFRNKMAYKEVSKLLCRFFREKRRQSKDDAAAKERAQQLLHHNSRDRSDSTPSAAGSNSNNDVSCSYPTAVMDYAPKFTPCIGKSPKRSSLKSLTANSPLAASPMSSTLMNSNSKPPFLRSMTVPEQTQRVKFPPNLIRQKSCVQRPVYSEPQHTLSPALSKRPKFIRQDSICSILSNDSVLMICAEDSLSASAESGLLLNRNGCGGKSGMMMMGTENGTRICNGSSSLSGGSSSGGKSPLPLQKNYLRQDSNFSETSHKTNDSGVVLSTKPSANTSPYLTQRQYVSPSRLSPNTHTHPHISGILQTTL